MENNVVEAVSQSLVKRGISALKFNFRGVGRSQGEFGGGTGELDDLRAALDYLSGRIDVDPARLGVAGYSFGGMVAAKLTPAETRIKALALVSPALSPAEMSLLASSGIPLFVISGEHDEFVASSSVRSLQKQLRLPSSAYVNPSADHFWWGLEAGMADSVAGFLSSNL
jgi:alpha/beta superfamily hydrolase